MPEQTKQVNKETLATQQSRNQSDRLTLSANNINLQ